MPRIPRAAPAPKDIQPVPKAKAARAKPETRSGSLATNSPKAVPPRAKPKAKSKPATGAPTDAAPQPRKRPTPTAPDLSTHTALTDTLNGFARAYQHWLENTAANPLQLVAWQQAQMQAQAELFLRQIAPTDEPTDPLARWSNYLRESHRLAGDALLASVDSVELDTEDRRRMRFFMRQMVDAMAPQNQLIGNAEALKLATETQGESLKAGIENLLTDMRRGRISMTDDSAFGVGKNLALTPGAVIYENPIFQLLQYAPTTPQVYQKPLLIVPPCINKYYILDLQPENSFVAHAVGAGHTVFLVSWRNVTPSEQHYTWSEYIENGVIEAIDTALAITGEKSLNALGFCVGGTLLGVALAALSARRQAGKVSSATFLTTLLDFSDVGEIRAYIDEPFVEAREAALAHGGLVSGAELAQAFASLRANDLIWSFVINNYLKGKKPAAFDLLYWNADSTNLPGPMYAYYLRNMYLENRLATPGALEVNGTPIDLSQVTIPAFVFAAREDHIVPWRTARESARLLGGKTTFVLGASGHIAGVVNPPAKGKRSFWSSGPATADHDSWLNGATETPGSWWPTWYQWLSAHGGKKIAGRKALGAKGYPIIEPAPGRYVGAKN
jgi:polyhydroxyalkanoate synthase subunit PhaC